MIKVGADLVRCPRCGGNVYFEDDVEEGFTDLKCLLCSRVLSTRKGAKRGGEIGAEWPAAKPKPKYGHHAYRQPKGLS